MPTKEFNSKAQGPRGDRFFLPELGGRVQITHGAGRLSDAELALQEMRNTPGQKFTGVNFTY